MTDEIIDKDVAASPGMPVEGAGNGNGGRIPGEGGNIHDLSAVAQDGDGRGNQEIIAIDGRVYERVRKPEDTIYELKDIVERGRGDAFSSRGMNEEMAGIIAQTAEKIAREMIPGIAERIIKEEIEKLKSDHDVGTDN